MTKSMSLGKTLSRIDSLIGVGTTINGDVEFEGGVRIDGRVSGHVLGTSGAEGTSVTVSEHGVVEGDIKAKIVSINGAVLGSVTGLQFVEVQAKARIAGDVRYGELEMQVGALVCGNLFHELLDSPARKVVSLKSANEPDNQ